MVHDDTRWRSRRFLGLLVGLVAFLLPIGVAIAVAVGVSRIAPRPDGTVAVVLWWALLTVVTTSVLVIVERAARRLLPLAALLRMSLVFPDRAPSRFRLALRAAGVRDLERRVRAARERGEEDEPAEAAERIITLMGALAMHDRQTRGHSERVRAFTDLLADELRLGEVDRERLRWAALLHDIGKLAVSPTILNKDGKPSADEWAVIHRHPEEGDRLARPLRGWLGPWADAIAHHHEKWDGSGYPFRLSGEDISYGARIVTVADSFEVMTSPRSYKRPMTAADARRELAVCAGSHFDPTVVRAFLNVSLGRLRWAMGPIAVLAQLPFVGGIPRVALRPLAERPPVTGAAVGALALALSAGSAAGPAAVAEAGEATDTTFEPVLGPRPGAVLGERFEAATGAHDLEHLVVRPTLSRTDAPHEPDDGPPAERPKGDRVAPDRGAGGGQDRGRPEAGDEARDEVGDDVGDEVGDDLGGAPAEHPGQGFGWGHVKARGEGHHKHDHNGSH